MSDGLAGYARFPGFPRNTPVPHADRPSIERYRVSFLSTKRAIQRIQRLMGFTGFSQMGRAGVHRPIYPILSALAGLVSELRRSSMGGGTSSGGQVLRWAF
eukprot:scaffold90907_cov72-Phaeocystis_antarctica.AAC.1